MEELKEIEIDGHKYEFSLFMAGKSIRVLTKLTKLLGEPLSMMMALGAKEDDGSIKEKDEAEIISKAVRSLMERVDEEEVLDLMKELAQNSCMCDGKKIQNFDLHYKGQIKHLFNVLKKSLEVQYGDFLEEMLRLAQEKGVS